ncbi:hypothetical protein NMY22_g14991 [Coprinellus aureogranulatus]|nr:hypothetical protein NMY22_g14991 [Coprinellus aureogranulatus]
MRIGCRCIAIAASPAPSSISGYSRRFALEHLIEFLATVSEECTDPFDGALDRLRDDLGKPAYEDGRPALGIAFRDRNWKLVRALVNAKVDINVQFKEAGNNMTTALQAACYCRKIDMIYLLLENGADPNTSGESKMIIQLSTLADAVQMVPCSGLAPSTTWNSAFHFGTPLAFASHQGDVELVNRLLSCGADPNFQGGYFTTALQAACDKINGSVEVVDILLEHGADPNQTGGRFGSALHACAYWGNTECVRALLEHKADPNMILTTHGSTPLYWACLRGFTEPGYIETVELLLDFGALNPGEMDPCSGDSRDGLPIEMWKAGDDSEIALLLRQRGIME